MRYFSMPFTLVFTVTLYFILYKNIHFLCKDAVQNGNALFGLKRVFIPSENQFPAY